MKLLKSLLLVLVSILIVLIIVMLVLGKKYHFETSTMVNAPIEKVYQQASASKKFNEWNPWVDLDPNLRVTYNEKQGVVGDEYCWEGDDNVGQGCHQITELVENQKISTKMMFKKPFESDATSDIMLVKDGEKTKVTWSMDCELDYPMNLMKFFMDGEMEKSYQKGLSKLKTIVE